MLLSLAYALFLGNFAFGIAVRTGAIPAARFRIVHKLLYTSVLLSLAAAIVADITTGSGAFWLLLLLGILLLGMPAFAGRSPAHTLYACICLAAYTTIVYVVLL